MDMLVRGFMADICRASGDAEQVLDTIPALTEDDSRSQTFRSRMLYGRSLIPAAAICFESNPGDRLRRGNNMSDEFRKLRIVDGGPGLPESGRADLHGEPLADYSGTRKGPVSFDPLLTAEEVAQRLRVSRDWVWDHSSRKTPRLPVIRMGDGALRYRASRIEEFIGERERLSATGRGRR